MTDAPSPSSVADFLDRLDAFAATLSPTDQSLLQSLIVGGETDDVAGFGLEPPWPGVRVIAPDKVTTLTTADPFLSSGHTSGNVDGYRGTTISGTDLGSGR